MMVVVVTMMLMYCCMMEGGGSDDLACKVSQARSDCLQRHSRNCKLQEETAHEIH
jgi:hypothetical protein